MKKRLPTVRSAIAIPGQAASRPTLAVTVAKLSWHTLSRRPILEDHVKASAPRAVARVFGCILIAGCAQTREANVPSPPATSYQVGSFELQEGGRSQSVRGASVTPIFFQVAKTPTLLGRGFLPDEYGSGALEVVIASHRLWQHRFRGDPRIIGATMRLNGQAFTVVGVMPMTFDVPSGVDIWVPRAGSRIGEWNIHGQSVRLCSRRVGLSSMRSPHAGRFLSGPSSLRRWA